MYLLHHGYVVYEHDRHFHDEGPLIDSQRLSAVPCSSRVRAVRPGALSQHPFDGADDAKRPIELTCSADADPGRVLAPGEAVGCASVSTCSGADAAGSEDELPSEYAAAAETEHDF